MPKIYEYLGIIIFFYANEHEPIHVHARYGERESKAEFIIQDGKIVQIIIKAVGNTDPLKEIELRNFNAFLKVYADKIVQKWVDFFVYKKKVEFERITKKIR
jgi:hypothetical protein